MEQPQDQYPIQFSVDYPDRSLRRLSSFFRLILVIPIVIVLGLVAGWGIFLRGGTVGLVRLLVGAIGVLNTMLMTVSERTREIGTLRAFGWRSSMVMRLILAEGLVTALLGGLCGSVLGWVAAELLMRLVPQGLLEAHYRPAVLLRGLGIALVVGILGALYPAWRASRLLPAEALRYE